MRKVGINFENFGGWRIVGMKRKKGCVEEKARAGEIDIRKMDEGRMENLTGWSSEAAEVARLVLKNPMWPER